MGVVAAEDTPPPFYRRSCRVPWQEELAGYHLIHLCSGHCHHLAKVPWLSPLASPSSGLLFATPALVTLGGAGRRAVLVGDSTGFSVTPR